MSEVKNSDSNFTFPPRITSFFSFFFKVPTSSRCCKPGRRRSEEGIILRGFWVHTHLPGSPLKLPEVRCSSSVAWPVNRLTSDKRSQRSERPDLAGNVAFLLANLMSSERHFPQA